MKSILSGSENNAESPPIELEDILAIASVA